MRSRRAIKVLLTIDEGSAVTEAGIDTLCQLSELKFMKKWFCFNGNIQNVMRVFDFAIHAFAEDLKP